MLTNKPVTPKKAPAAMQTPAANIVCFCSDHSSKITTYQSDVATCDFNVDVSDSIVDNRVCIGGTSDATHTQDVLAGCLLTVR